MMPAFAAPAKAPLRMMFNYVPNGLIMKDWTPTAQGSAFELPRIYSRWRLIGIGCC